MIMMMALVSELIPGTVSPSKTFGVHHSQVNTADVNDLVNLKTGKPVVRLKGFSGFEGENHGGVVAAYNKSETLAVFMHEGKWEPRALSLVHLGAGKQMSMLKQVQSDSKGYYLSRPKSKKLSGMVFQVTGAKFVGDAISFSIIGEVPKDDESAATYHSVTYNLKSKVAPNSNAFVLGKPVFKSLTEKDGFSWPVDGR
ncbi:MAG: hypothetical protein WCK51_07580 [Armatimonadota bacterium]